MWLKHIFLNFKKYLNLKKRILHFFQERQVAKKLFKGTAGEKLKKEVVKKSKAIVEDEQISKKSSRTTQEQEKIKVFIA